MAAKTLYFKNTTPNGASNFGCLQEGATITALTMGAGWAAETHAVGDFGPQTGPFGQLAVGSGLWTTSALPSTAVPDDSIGDAWRSELPYYGTFANANWTFSYNFRATTAANFDGRCRMNFRVFRGSNPTGSGATEITSGLITTAATTSNINTASDDTVTATWSPGGTITLNGEYLFVKAALEITTQGTAAGNIRCRGGASAFVTTSDWTPASGPKQFWLKDAVPTGATNHRSLQEGGSAITAATTGTGWTAGTNANTLYCIQNGGSEIALADGQWTSTAQPAAASLSTTIGDAWRSENALSCTFQAQIWGFQFAGRSVTGNYTGRYSIRIRVYKSANQDGSSATELTGSALASPATTQGHATSLDTITTISWAPGSTITFNNEYLFVQVAIDITTAGNSASLDVLHRVGSAAMLGVITPDLVTARTVTASLSDTADVGAATAAAKVSASASASDTADTLAATATAKDSASAALNDTADTLAATVTVSTAETNASAALNDTADVGAATATVKVSATASAADTGDTVTASGAAIIAASLSQTDIGDALAATATAALAAALSASDTADALAASVGLKVSLSLAAMDDADSLVAHVSGPGISADLIDSPDTTAAFLTVRVSASVAGTDSADALASSVILPVSIALSTQEQSDILAAGIEVSVGVQTNAADDFDTLASQIASRIVAQYDVVDQADTLAATVTLFDAGDLLTNPNYKIDSTQPRFSVASSQPQFSVVSSQRPFSVASSTLPYRVG